MRQQRHRRPFAWTLCLPLLLGALLLPASSLSAQTSIPIPRVAAGDTLTLRLAIGTDTVRVVERDTVLVRDTLVVTDTVTVFQHDTVLVVDTLIVRDTLRLRDTVFVRDTIWVERPAEPEPDPVEEPAPADSIIAWMPIVEPSARYDTLAVGDTVRLTVVGATVTAITPDGTRITRAATMDEIRAAGFYWIHSGVGARRNEAPDGTSTTFVSTGLYGSRVTHVTLMLFGRNTWRLVVTNVPRDPSDSLPPAPDAQPDPVEEPEDPPVLDPCDGPCPEPPPLWLVDSLSGAIEFDGATMLEVGVSGRPDPEPSYHCARVLAGSSATVVGDTIRVAQDPESSIFESLWCIPYNWPVVWGEVRLPAEPHGERSWYAPPGEPLPSRGSGADGVRGL